MHPIVQEEEQLLAAIRTKLLERPIVAQASERDIIKELTMLRQELGGAKQEDLGAMLQQYDQLHALLNQIRNARQVEEVDPDNPYFAHMRLNEEGGTRDLYLGKATRIDHGLRIIDWRNAPIAQLFYRYQEGEEYVEEVGDRVFEGILEARRTVSVHGGQLDRVAAPQGVFTRGEDGGWEEIPRTLPKLAGGEGAAAVVAVQGAAQQPGLHAIHLGAQALPGLAGGAPRFQDAQ